MHYDGSTVPAIVIFISTGLLVYWVARMGILWHGSEVEIQQTLETDLLWFRTFLLRLRSVFMPTIQLAG
jgi:hypothetical protein